MPPGLREPPSPMRRLARWIRRGTPGTVRVPKAVLSVEELNAELGGSPTWEYPVLYVDGRAYAFEPSGSEVFVTLKRSDTEAPA